MSEPLPKEPIPLNSRAFTPPPVQIGEPVHWWPYGEIGVGAKPVPAIVTEIGTRTLHLSLIAAGAKMVIPKEGVRHVSDPDAKRDEFKEVGAWSYSPIMKLLRDLGLESEMEMERIGTPEAVTQPQRDTIYPPKAIPKAQLVGAK